MERKYWERIAPAYETEIFDVLQNDRKSVIRSAIKKIASPRKTVLDAGCAVGKWLPFLSPLFKKVIAVDISSRNLAIAKSNNSSLGNVSYRRADLSSKLAKVPPVETIICVNAILSDANKKRSRFFSHLAHALKPNGNLVLVVPSLESWLLTRIIQRQWKLDVDVFREKLSGKTALKRYHSIQEGNAEIDNVYTKHYLAEELQLILRREKLEVDDIQKVNYTWKTEFRKPPVWLKDPLPWDWMVIARKPRQ